ncbi:hypothetical protein QTP70_021016 [Hemibagrus guttatus]|uniref:ribonuclease H n=1 Tax=Hemibagrus guttatus TaxID=175788 RepID=A0AAE0USU4_9TELE|nr:hypothetical protein QTP70_021016 [Hemibagrus guttatus]KAK3544629.1 hypothetical protein QTP86_019129 [Hemibagrus guttatus]
MDPETPSTQQVLNTIIQHENAFQCHGVLAQQETLMVQHSQLLSEVLSSIRQTCNRLPPTQTATSAGVPEPLPSPQVPAPHVELCLPPPQCFSGDPSACRGFLTQCSLTFELQPSSFPSDRAKVSSHSSLVKPLPDLHRHKLNALMYSGAAGNFMDMSLVKSLQIPVDSLPAPLTITALDGRPLSPGKVTIHNQYPLCLMATTFELLQGASIFTKLNLRNAYHLVRIRQGDEWKTAFNPPTWHYEYQVMSFGLTNAPAVFHALINNVLRDMLNQFVFVYLDNILIYSKSTPEHVEHVIVEPGCIQMDPQKVQAVFLDFLIFIKITLHFQPSHVRLIFGFHPSLWLSDRVRLSHRRPEFDAPFDASDAYCGSGGVVECRFVNGGWS